MFSQFQEGNLLRLDSDEDHYSSFFKGIFGNINQVKQNIFSLVVNPISDFRA